MPVVVGNFDGLYRSDTTSMTDCNGLCVVNVTGVGFYEECEDSLKPYDIPMTDITNNIPIFDARINFDQQNPYQIMVNTTYKDSSDCSGNMTVRGCVLKLGKVQYQVSVFHNIPKDDTETASWEWTIIDGLTAGGQFVRTTAFEPWASNPYEFYGDNTTFGGIAVALQSYFDSTFSLQSDPNGKTLLEWDGSFAQQISPTTTGVPNWCNTSFTEFGATTWNINTGSTNYSRPTDYLLDQIRSTFLYTSLYAADNFYDGADSIQTLY
jgi:hypothetical protein